MRRPIRILAAILAAIPCATALTRGVGHAVAADAACPARTVQQGDDDTTLAVARAALLAGGDVDVLALGTTLGQGSDPLETLTAAIEAVLPRTHLHVTPIGHHGMTAGELLDALREAMPARPYRLVIWQTGTWEAARSLNPEEFQDALSQGAAFVQQAGADLVLVNPQFSRFLQSNADVNAYLSVMQLSASLPSVGLFDRFAVTHDWAENGDIDLERADKDLHAATLVHLQHCVGAALADYILATTVRRTE